MEQGEEEIFFNKMARSGGHQKILHYFREVVVKQRFQNFIEEMRLQYDIPLEGFKDPTKLYLPYPNKWKFRDDKVKNSELEKELEQILKEYKLGYSVGMDAVKTYLFYNIVEISTPPMANSSCFISDLTREKELPFLKKILEEENLSFPIALRISPLASKRDILDYITKSYKEMIEPMQKRYRVEESKTTRFKKKKKSDRDNFIYENRGLSRKEITSLVQSKFKEFLDYAYIGKIISNEKIRRKKP